MPPVTTSLRSTIKQALVDTLTPTFAALVPAIPVVYGWPSADIREDGVFVTGPAPGKGAIEYPLMMAGRKIRDDQFVLTVTCAAVVQEAKTPHDADVRAEQLYAVLEDLFATSQTLNELDPAIVSALLGPEVTGPDGEVIPTGAFATVVADVSFHVRLQ